jgi:heat shock protein HslJ
MRHALVLSVILCSIGCASGSQDVTSPGSVDNSATMLVGVRWDLVQLGSQPVSLDPSRTPYLIFQSSERVAGSDGCNQIAGSYQASGTEISLGPLLSTLIACPWMGETDVAYRSALSGAQRWTVAAGQLELADAAGSLLARFRAAAP